MADKYKILWEKGAMLSGKLDKLPKEDEDEIRVAIEERGEKVRKFGTKEWREAKQKKKVEERKSFLKEAMNDLEEALRQDASPDASKSYVWFFISNLFKAGEEAYQELKKDQHFQDSVLKLQDEFLLDLSEDLEANLDAAERKDQTRRVENLNLQIKIIEDLLLFKELLSEKK